MFCDIWICLCDAKKFNEEVISNLNRIRTVVVINFPPIRIKEVKRSKNYSKFNLFQLKLDFDLKFLQRTDRNWNMLKDYSVIMLNLNVSDLKFIVQILLQLKFNELIPRYWIMNLLINKNISTHKIEGETLERFALRQQTLNWNQVKFYESKLLNCHVWYLNRRVYSFGDLNNTLLAIIGNQVGCECESLLSYCKWILINSWRWLDLY